MIHSITNQLYALNPNTGDIYNYIEHEDNYHIDINIICRLIYPAEFVSKQISQICIFQSYIVLIYKLSIDDELSSSIAYIFTVIGVYVLIVYILIQNILLKVCLINQVYMVLV